MGVLVGRRLLEEPLIKHEHIPAREPLPVNERPHRLLWVQLDEFLVHAAWLGEAEAAVFVEYHGERPLLQLPEASDQTPGSMLALIAVDQHGVVAPIEDCCQSGSDGLIGYC